MTPLQDEITPNSQPQESIQNSDPTEHLSLIEHKIVVDVFKGYLDTTLTANIWFYAVTGAVVTFYLSHKDIPFLNLALLLPIVLSLLSIYLCYRGIRRAEELEAVMLKKPCNHKGDNFLKFAIRIMNNSYQKEHAAPTNFLIAFLKSTICLILLMASGLTALFVISCRHPDWLSVTILAK